MAKLLEIRNLTFCRDAFTLSVEHLQLQVAQTSLLTGPNGAGKSTLLHILALLQVPTSGDIIFDGCRIDSETDRQQLRRQITLVEQNPFLFDGTVYQNLAYGLRLRDIKGDLQRRRVGRALDSVGLSGFEERRAKMLSGGEIRRVALARALVLEPKLLLLDEPTAGLDDEVVSVFERLIEELPERGVTVVLSNHERQLPRQLKAQRLSMHGGVVRVDGCVDVTRGTRPSPEKRPCLIPLKAQGS